MRSDRGARASSPAAFGVPPKASASRDGSPQTECFSLRRQSAGRRLEATGTVALPGFQLGRYALCAVFFLALLALPARAEKGVQEIVVVYKTHFDIGYTDLVTNVLTRYRTKFVDGAMQAIDHSRSLPPGEQFVWTVPGWPLKEMLWSGQTPERRAKIVQALKEGRLTAHAMPFSLQTESLDLEDLVRGMTFSTDLARENGLPLPRAAKMTDVPEHTWVLPTLLKHAGVEFLQIGCNGGSAPMRVPPLFWWEGPDGSRLLTSFSPEYGTPLVPPHDWPYHTWLAMIMTGDNHGPPTTEEVDNLLRQAAKEAPGVKIRFGRLEDFYDAIMAEKNDNIPVVRGDMPDTWIHGFEAFPMETKLAWNVRPLEGAVAMLDTELRAAGLNPSPLAELLARAYENSLLYSEHTFGFYGSQPGGFWYGEEWKQKLADGAYDRFLKSFEDKSDYIRTTANIVTNAVDERMRLLAQNVAAEGARVVVFNPLPWKRSGEVEIQLPEGACTSVRDLTSGRIVEISAVDGRTMRFVARDVPPGGYKTFQPVADAVAKEYVSTSGGVIENKFFRLKVDASRGGLVSLVDLQTGRELVATTDENSFGSYWHERFANTNVGEFVKSYARGHGGWVDNDFGKPGMPGPDQSPYAALTLTNWTVSVQAGPLAKTILLRSADAAPLAKAVTLQYTLYEARPYLDVEWTVEGKTPNPIPEGGWLCLPFAINQPKFQLARLGSLIDPAKDIIDGGNRHLLCLNSGMTITGLDGYGVGLCPMDSPLVSLDEPGLWKFSWQYTPQRARIFVNLYNNQWDTNFRLWQEGSWNSRVRIWAIRGDNAEKNLLTPAWEARAPLLAACGSGPGGKLPVTKTGLSLSRHGVLVTHFGPDPYSDRTLLRVWEQAGHSGSLTVKLPADVRATRACPVNLRGEPAGSAMKIAGHSFTFQLAAFTPASFRLE
ncbi:MAG: glycoside hydrolase family 38 C-terminal domain-containing protein [Limisphaerales bacterium]